MTEAKDLNPVHLFSLDQITTKEKPKKNNIEVLNVKQFEQYAGVDKFVASVVHDIRSPLAVINIILSTMIESISTDDYAILKEATQNIHEITNNLLSKFEATKTQEPIASRVNLHKLINNIIKQKKIEWQNNSCEIIFNVSDEAKNKRVFGLEIDFKRIISNLLNNSFEALDSNRKILLTLTYNNNQLNLCIEDYGIGIPKEWIHQVIIGKSLKTGGNGFGLSEAKKFIENRGDKFTITSEVGKGTIVILSLITCE